ncbi:hypothetical protein PUN28_019006 [Cardiocondyla obscurior]|uniref:Uncharacterized protein n=1 Tax=Cardiocondyla obscurior TaxID=286306 RepID=A0AAW2EDV4_9HYME
MFLVKLSLSLSYLSLLYLSSLDLSLLCPSSLYLSSLIFLKSKSKPKPNPQMKAKSKAKAKTMTMTMAIVARLSYYSVYYILDLKNLSLKILMMYCFDLQILALCYNDSKHLLRFLPSLVSLGVKSFAETVPLHLMLLRNSYFC